MNTDADKEDMLSFLNITGSVNEWLQLEPMPMVKRPDNEGNRATPVSSPEDEDMNVASTSEADASNVMYISDWLPPEPLTTKEFTALPT